MSTFETIKNEIIQLLNYSLTQKETNNILNNIALHIKSDSKVNQDLINFVVEVYKKNNSSDSSYLFIKICSLFTNLDAKIFSEIFKALTVLDSKRRMLKYISACKLVSKMVSIDCLPQKMNLSLYGIILHMKNSEESDILLKFANNYIESLESSTVKNRCSHKIAHKISESFGKDIFQEKILPLINKHVDKNPSKFLPIYSSVLPCFEFDVNDQSVLYTILNKILSANQEEKASLYKFFKSSVKAYNMNQVTIFILKKFGDIKVSDKKRDLLELFSYLDLGGISKETFEAILNFIEKESSVDVVNKIMNSFRTVKDFLISFILGIEATNLNYRCLCSILSKGSSYLDKIEMFIRNNYEKDILYSLIVLKDLNIDLDMNEFNKVDVSKLDTIDKVKFYLYSGNYTNIIPNNDVTIKLLEKLIPDMKAHVLEPFILFCIDSDEVMDNFLDVFDKYVRYNHVKFNDRRVTCLFQPKLAKAEDTHTVLSYLKKRRSLVIRSISEIGYNEIIHKHIDSSFQDFFENPISSEDSDLVVFKEDIMETHSSASEYRAVKNELASPNSTSNIPQLKKQLEKLYKKVSSTQSSLRNEIIDRYILPIMGSLYILITLFRKYNEAPYLSRFFSSLLRLRKYKNFVNVCDDAIMSCLRSQNVYRNSANLVFIALTSDALSDSQIQILTPTKLTDSVLHIVSDFLGELLTKPAYSNQFCDINCITSHTDTKRLLPIYLSNSDVSDSIFNFSIALSNGRDNDSVAYAFNYLLSTIKRIRECSVKCLRSSSISMSSLNCVEYCKLIVNSVSFEDAEELLSQSNVDFPMSEVLDAFYEFAKTVHNDLELCHDTGISFGQYIKAASPDEGLEFLFEIYKDSIVCEEEDLEIDQKNSLRRFVSFALLSLETLTLNVLDFVFDTLIDDSDPIVLKNFVKLSGFYLEKLDDPSFVLDKLNKEINKPIVKEKTEFYGSIIKILGGYYMDKHDKKIDLLDAVFKIHIFSGSLDYSKSCAEVISQLMKKDMELISKYKSLLLKTPDLTSKEKQMGFAFSYAAILHAGGNASLKDEELLNMLDSYVKSKNTNQRVTAGYIFAGLSSLYKRTLEMTLPQIIPNLLVVLGDSDDNVRDAADYAAKCITENFTKACAKYVLPYVLTSAADNVDWRRSYGATKLIRMAITSSSNIGSYIPDIIKCLNQAVNSVSREVREEANLTLRLLKSSMSNEAIASIYDLLIEAVQNYSLISKVIKSISNMRLETKLDSISAALLTPPLLLAAESKDSYAKNEAIKVLGSYGSICTESTLVQFSDDILPLIIKLITDASPETRLVSSRSLSKFCNSLPLEYYEKVLNDLLKEFPNKVSVVEAQGYSQAIASLVHIKGVESLNNHIKSFIEKASVSNTNINERSSYISLLGYLAFYYGPEDFHSYFDAVISVVLDAAAESNDSTRTVGLSSIQLLSRTFANKYPEEIIAHFNACSLKDNWRCRVSGIALMKSFVLSLLNLDESEEKEGREVGDTMKLLAERINPECLSSSLMILYVISNDTKTKVRDDAYETLRYINPNIGSIVKHNSAVLEETLETFLSSEFQSIREIGALAVEKIIKIKNEFYPMIESLIKKLLGKDQTVHSQHGAILTLSLIKASFKGREIELCGLIFPFLSSSEEILRSTASTIYRSMSDVIGGDSNDIMRGLTDYIIDLAEKDGDAMILSGLVSIICESSVWLLLNRFLELPISPSIPKAASKLFSLIPGIDETGIMQFVERLISNCYTNYTHKSEDGETIDDSKLSYDVAYSIIRSLTGQLLDDFIDRFIDNMRSQNPKYRECCSKFAFEALKKFQGDLTNVSIKLIRQFQYSLDDPVDEIVFTSFKVFEYLSEYADSQNIESLITELANNFSSLCTVSRVRAFNEFPHLFSTFDKFIFMAFRSNNVTCTFQAAIVLSRVLPQLSEPPVSIKRYFAAVIYSIQWIHDEYIFEILLKCANEIFNKISNEKDMFQHSFPNTLIKFFKGRNTKIHQLVSETLVAYSLKFESKTHLLKMLANVVRFCGTPSLGLLTSIESIITKAQVTLDLFKELFECLVSKIDLKNKNLNFKLSNIISSLVIASPESSSDILLNETSLFSTDDSSMIIISSMIVFDIMKVNKQGISKRFVDMADSLIDKLLQIKGNQYTIWYVKLLIVKTVCDPNLLQNCLIVVNEIIKQDEMEVYVEVIRALALFEAIDLDVILSTNLLDMLLEIYQSKELAKVSSSSRVIHALFLNDHTDEERVVLSSKLDNAVVKMLFNKVRQDIHKEGKRTADD